MCLNRNLKEKTVEALTKEYTGNLEKKPQLFPKTNETLLELKKKGVYLVLLSEGIESDKKEILENQGIYDIFDMTKFVQNKEEKYFQETIKRLREIGYTNVYCVGDSIKKDIRFGNETGCLTIWIPSKWETQTPKDAADWPNYKINRISEVS